MSSFEEDVLSDDVADVAEDVDIDSSEEIPELEAVDQIDDDADLEGRDDEEDVEEDEGDIISEVEDRNHKVIRIVAPDDRITSHVIQLPEMTEAIGIRASQIEQGSEVLTDVTGYTDPIAMAKKEFVDRRNPLIVERAIRESPSLAVVEHWKVREMTFPITDREVLMISTPVKVKIANVAKGGDAAYVYGAENFSDERFT